MAHKTLIGGTAYDITGGRTLVNGTGYNISKGRTLINGTGYDITFDKGGYAVSYRNTSNTQRYDLVFQEELSIDTTKNHVSTYHDFEFKDYDYAMDVPWQGPYGQLGNYYSSVIFEGEFKPKSIAYWFNNFARVNNSIDDFKLDRDKITNLDYAFSNCINIKGNVFCGPNVTNMSYAFYNCRNMTGTPGCTDKVYTMTNSYYNCRGITGSPACGANVRQMVQTYAFCGSLTGNPVCGPYTTNMYGTFTHCTKLTGAPVCGNRVTDFTSTYSNCYNLQGIPVSGPNVTHMIETYRHCHNLTGAPACSNKVQYFQSAYSHCYNLTGPAICGISVQNASYAYQNCSNLQGNVYFYSSVISDASYCFANKNNSIRLNIYVPANSVTNTTVHYTNYASLIGKKITWTDAGTYQYNTTYNLYLYPVSNVAAARAANGD